MSIRRITRVLPSLAFRFQGSPGVAHLLAKKLLRSASTRHPGQPMTGIPELSNPGVAPGAEVSGPDQSETSVPLLTSEVLQRLFPTYSDRHLQVLQLILRGNSVKSISRELGLAHGAVTVVTMSLLRDLEVNTRVQLILVIRRILEGDLEFHRYICSRIEMGSLRRASALARAANEGPRCPKCKGPLATERARQCLGRGHDWHASQSAVPS
jgi:DNA-binding CsgD family transcriptional regulator